MKITSKSSLRIFGTAALTITVASAVAAPRETGNHFDWSIGAGAQHSDNITRVEANEQDETIATANLFLDVSEHRPRTDLDLASNLNYQNYLNNSYSDQVVGGLSGKLDLALVPEHFLWSAMDNFGQTRADPLSPESPVNRENFNIFTTGPDFIANLSARTSAQLAGRWSKLTYGQAGVDNDRYSGELSLVRTLSGTSSSDIHVSDTRVRFDGAASVSDYDIQEASLGLQAATTKTQTSIRGGYTRIEPRTGERSGGLLFNLQFERALGARSKWTLQGGTQYTDASGALVLDQEALGVARPASNVVITTDTFRADYGYTSLQLSGARTTLALGANARRERHQAQTNLDVDTYGFDVRILRKISARLEFGLSGLLGNQKFVANGLESRDWSAGATLSWRFTPAFSVVAEYDRLHGVSDAPYHYDENRASLMFVYSHAR